jgi:hypothetical protein
VGAGEGGYSPAPESLLDTTEATRWASRKMDRPFTILGLTS